MYVDNNTMIKRNDYLCKTCREKIKEYDRLSRRYYRIKIKEVEKQVSGKIKVNKK